MMVRRLKGAYCVPEVKNAQKYGWTQFPVFIRKTSNEVSYQACENRVLEYRYTIQQQFATNNAYPAATKVELAGYDKAGFE